MMQLTSSLALLAFASSALAHFTLDYPLSRGFDEDIESDNFCGGFHNVSLPRQPWYYANGPIEIDSHHDSATVNIYISFSPPTGSESFLATTNGTAVPPLRHDLAISGQGEFCFHANASSLNVAGIEVRNGTEATIMVEYINNVHGHLYQCTDVVFTSDQSVGSNITCTDALTAASTSGGASGTASASGSASTATSTAPAASKPNGASATQASMAGLLMVPALLLGFFTLA